MKITTREPVSNVRTALLLCIGFSSCALLPALHAGPSTTLIYKGYLDGGAPAAVFLRFDDDRLPVNSQYWGFYNAGGRPAWIRLGAVAGHMTIYGYVVDSYSNTRTYDLGIGETDGGANFVDPQILPTDGSRSFPGRITFEGADNNFVYMDEFLLTANPFGPGPTYYRFYLDVVATPAITPNGGNFSGPVQVTLGCSTPGATIYYVTNSTSPAAVYSGPFTLSSSATVIAQAVKTGSTDSYVTSATFTITAVPPSLGLTRSGNSLILSWPSSSAGYVLEQNSNLRDTAGWTTTATQPVDNGSIKTVTIGNSTGNLFFRLRKAS